MPPTSRETAAVLEQSLVEMKVGLGDLRRAREATERELAGERRQLADAERRGALAALVPDPETVRVAEEFAAKHRERIGVLERKLAVQGDEVTLAEREAGELAARWREARRGLGPNGMTPSIEAAWRDLQAAGGQRPGTDLEGELVRSETDHVAREAAADAQLAHLKKKMGK
ncbi:MAG: hypothetical protein ACHQXA_03830 [Gemmatimonadales bacterium]